MSHHKEATVGSLARSTQELPYTPDFNSIFCQTTKASTTTNTTKPPSTSNTNNNNNNTNNNNNMARFSITTLPPTHRDIAASPLIINQHQYTATSGPTPPLQNFVGLSPQPQQQQQHNSFVNQQSCQPQANNFVQQPQLTTQHNYINQQQQQSCPPQANFVNQQQSLPPNQTSHLQSQLLQSQVRSHLQSHIQNRNQPQGSFLPQTHVQAPFIQQPPAQSNFVQQTQPQPSFIQQQPSTQANFVHQQHQHHQHHPAHIQTTSYLLDYQHQQPPPQPQPQPYPHQQRYYPPTSNASNIAQASPYTSNEVNLRQVINANSSPLPVQPQATRNYVLLPQPAHNNIRPRSNPQRTYAARGQANQADKQTVFIPQQPVNGVTNNQSELTSRIPVPVRKLCDFGAQFTPESSNKGCQFDGTAPMMIHRSMNATVGMVDCESQTTETRTFVDRASSPINFPPTDVPVRRKFTVKKRKVESKSESSSDTDINVLE